MKYVRHFNDETFNELIDDFERIYEELFYKLRGYNSTISRDNGMLEPTEIKGKRGITHRFPIAEKVYEIYQWLIGNRKTPPTHTEDTLYEILHLAYFNPVIEYSELSHDIEWERWRAMSTGAFYYATDIALRLHKKESINASELAFLTHVHHVTVLKQIKTEKYPAYKVGNVWRIESSVAKEWINNYNEKNPFGEEENAWDLPEVSKEAQVL